ncbi:hypothetical protein A33Q_1242 [Indibacter alkaliphilus LW1]|uniref:Uncharacterized protein n=1 Tax=Indibacter alkaliphilus (strain CCUG 57479 / KCTC 22604 / LW1) TaxID=1189612 RepID=S2E8I5_INDAL|nr:hypothetical protein A33Q_1242 [Indibacter alkaliphilus LW1]
MIFFPCKKGSSRSDKGSMVLLPAPGGAVMISVLLFCRFNLVCARMSQTGKPEAVGENFKS